MSNIFGNSWLTICAPASNSCLEGFLDPADRHSGTIEIEYVAKRSQKVRGSFLLRLVTLNGKPGFPGDAWIPGLAPLQRDLRYSEWNTRGWVFQEKILSQRLLYFGARMIHFQRGDHITSENGFSVHADFFNPRSDTTDYYITNLVRQLHMIENRGPFITDFWYKMVTIMNPSNFTDRRDTLPAIAGIARRVHEFTKHRYLAGLWEEDLSCGLLWMPDETSDPLISRYTPTSLRQLIQIIKKQANSIAPSWSWASRRSLLELRIQKETAQTCRVRSHLRAEFEVLQSRVLVDGVNAYGRIKSASISLSGSMIRLTPGLLAPSRRDSMADQLYEIFPDLFAYIQTDWGPVKFKAKGIKKQMQAHFHLLLIASCCSDWSRNSNTPSAHSAPQSERAESKSEPAHHPHAGAWSGRIVPPEERQEMLSEALKGEYIDSYYDDGHPGFDAAVHCGLCSDHKLRRDIWGLLIYQAGPADTFYRVGTFYSRAQHGGSAIFEGAKPCRIVLV